ncbi:MAG: hypothetical protein ACTSQU_15205, partial [Promethearchaeota archaeon]
MKILKKKNLSKITCIISLVLISNSFFSSLLPINRKVEDSSLSYSPLTSQGGVYWPTNSSEWTEVNPADQGLDATKISQMFDLIESSSYDVHSVIIVKNGYLIREEFLNDSQ